MRIQIDQEEIEVAIKDFITTQGINLDNTEVEIDLTAGRGSNGFTAVVAFTNKDTTIKVEKEKEEIPEDIELGFNAE